MVIHFFIRHVKRIEDLTLRHVPFLERNRTARQFVKFCIVGFSNLFIDFTVYLFMTRLLDVYFVAANLVAFLIAVTWSFMVNQEWTFRGALTTQASRRYVQFFVTNGIGAAIQTSLLYLLVAYGSWHDIVAKAAAVVVAVTWNFVVSKYWVFRIR